MKKYLKSLIPEKWLIRYRMIKEINHIQEYEKKRTIIFSSTQRSDYETCLTKLMIESHTLEKGITMPNRRLGFGQDRVRCIIENCRYILEQWGVVNSIEFQSAIANLRQYKDIHEESNFRLPNELLSGISELLPYLMVADENNIQTTKDDFFRPCSDFEQFAYSRHSVRSFSKVPVDEGKLMRAIRIAQVAPSACNRQATRVKIISTQEGKNLCCSLQHGNRGFGDKADKWLLITTELGAWSHRHIRNGFIDAGIFTANLLYALHYEGIAACTLNALLTPEEREELRKKLGYPESEEPVCFVVIGNASEEFMVCRSRRLELERIVQKI